MYVLGFATTRTFVLILVVLSLVAPMPAAPRTYDELKEAIARAYPTLSPQLQRIVALRAREAARPRARHRRGGRRGQRGAAVVDDPLRQRARLRRLLADAAGVPEPPGRALGAATASASRRCAAAAAATRRRRRRAAPVRRRGDRRAAAARGARRRGAARRGGDAARRARRRSTCWRSGARFRSPATSPTRSTSSSCARTCSTASAACSSEFAHAIRRRRRAAGRELSQLLAGGRSRRRSPAARRGVSVIAITDSALSPLKPAADVCFELGDDSTRAVPLAGRAAVPGAGAGRQRRPPARRPARPGAAPARPRR